MLVHSVDPPLPASPQRMVGSARPAGIVAGPAPAGQEADATTLSDQAKEVLAAARRKAPLPQFGRFQLGGPGPLAFGPDQFASALTKIPGDGYKTPLEGVDLGHQPARGLNLLG